MEIQVCSSSDEAISELDSPFSRSSNSSGLVELPIIENQNDDALIEGNQEEEDGDEDLLIFDSDSECEFEDESRAMSGDHSGSCSPSLSSNIIYDPSQCFKIRVSNPQRSRVIR